MIRKVESVSKLLKNARYHYLTDKNKKASNAGRINCKTKPSVVA